MKYSRKFKKRLKKLIYEQSLIMGEEPFRYRHLRLVNTYKAPPDEPGGYYTTSIVLKYAS